MKTQFKFAVVLTGCGVFDGSEIHEATMTLYALEKNGVSYQIFAPDMIQTQTVNHYTKEQTSEKRNVLVESARIARGKIQALDKLNVSDFDGLIFAGGYGMAKNASSFAFEGENCTVNQDVEKAIKGMAAAKKPIGAWCIAPVVIAKVLGKVRVTIGNDKATAQQIEAMGGTHINAINEVVIDGEHKIVSTPCYMHSPTLVELTDSIEKSIQAMIRLCE